MASVKICGITSESDLEMAVEAGADMVGFVIVETSPRFVDFEHAQALKGQHRLRRTGIVDHDRALGLCENEAGRFNTTMRGGSMTRNARSRPASLEQTGILKDRSGDLT